MCINATRVKQQKTQQNLERKWEESKKNKHNGKESTNQEPSRSKIKNPICVA